MALAQQCKSGIECLKKSCDSGNFCVFFATSQPQIMFFQFLKKIYNAIFFPENTFKKIKKMLFLKNAIKKTHENREKIHEKHGELFKTHRVQDVQNF